MQRGVFHCMHKVRSGFRSRLQNAESQRHAAVVAQREVGGQAVVGHPAGRGPGEPVGRGTAFQPHGLDLPQGKLGSSLFRLSETEKLDGVYCCNKGYCEFRPVEISYQNNEYCIIKKNTSGGLSAYDHIILDPKVIREDDIIY